MQVRKESTNQVIDLNPNEEIEITSDLGVMDEISVSAIVTSPPEKNENGSCRLLTHARFGFSAEEVISDIGAEQVHLMGVEFKKFKVKNPNDFTITASIRYNSRA